MKPSPPGWPRISSSLWYKDAAKAIDWLEKAFGFETRLRIDGDDGTIVHSELTYGDGLIMVGTAAANEAHPEMTWRAAPGSVGGMNTQNVMVYVDDVDAHCEQARKAGAKITQEPKTTDYGEGYWTDRSYGCADLEGHNWWFCQRLKSR